MSDNNHLLKKITKIESWVYKSQNGRAREGAAALLRAKAEQLRAERAFGPGDHMAMPMHPMYPMTPMYHSMLKEPIDPGALDAAAELLEAFHYSRDVEDLRGALSAERLFDEVRADRDKLNVVLRDTQEKLSKLEKQLEQYEGQPNTHKFCWSSSTVGSYKRFHQLDGLSGVARPACAINITKSLEIGIVPPKGYTACGHCFGTPADERRVRKQIKALVAKGAVRG